MGRILNVFNGKKSLIFSMGRNPEHFQWEEILNIFNGKKSLIFSMGKILNIFNGKKSLIFSMGEILNIFNGKKSLIFSVGRNPQYIPNTDSYTTKRLRTVQRSNGLLVFIYSQMLTEMCRAQPMSILFLRLIYRFSRPRRLSVPKQPCQEASRVFLRHPAAAQLS